MASESNPASSLTGTLSGRFAVGVRLGAGGMGEVYRAEDLRLKRSVAIKRLAPRWRDDPTYRQRFLREGQRASALNQPHIAGIYDVLEENHELYLVMEFIDGATLRERLVHPLETAEVLRIGIQCAEALKAAHDKGIVHGDIKPENIMLTPAGEVKVLDFGVARRLPESDLGGGTASIATGDAMLSGTPAYMAPERLLGRKADGRADIFALGVVLYEALAGRNPFRGETFAATTDRILRQTPPPLSRINPSVPAEVERVVNRALAKDAARRYATAQELLEDLRQLERGFDAGRLVPRQRRRFLPSRRFTLPAFVAAILIVIAVIAAVAWKSGFLRHSRTRLSLAPPAARQLAVLPFDAVGGDANLQAFADGLTDTLTGKLTQLTTRPSLQVFPAREVYLLGVKTVEEAQKQFGANLVLTGSLQSSGGRVRVTTVLIDARTRRQVGSQTVTASLADAFAVEDQVVAGSVQMLGIEPRPKEQAALAAHGTEQPGAYDDYLEGSGYIVQFQKLENLERGIRAFKRALHVDPNYGLAYAGLGMAYWYMYDAHTKDPAWVERARAACNKAASLGNGGAEAHACLGLVDNGTGNYRAAAGEYKRVLELEPTNDDGYGGLATAFESLGNFDEAEKIFQKAISVRPNYGAPYGWLASFYFDRGRYDDAARMFKAMIRLEPDSFVGFSDLGGAYIMAGKFSEAIAPLRTSIGIQPTAAAYSNLATAYYYLHKFTAAARNYEEATRLEPHAYDLWGNLGDAYYWAPGERNRAPAAYQKAVTLARQALAVNPKDSVLLSYVATYEAMLGDRATAFSFLAQALLAAPAGPEVMFNAALIYHQFGQKDQALDCLGKAVKGGYSAAMLRDTPNFGNLYGDPRFQKLLLHR